MPETRTKSTRRPERPATAEEASATDGDGARPLVCNVAFCPICLAVTAAQGSAPDAVEHLLNAAREFFLAARAVIDARGDHLSNQNQSGPRRLEKIEIA